MCRNIRTLFNFEPPATDDEIRASALQFVRKLSGFNIPSKANEDAFNDAVGSYDRSVRPSGERVAKLGGGGPKEIADVQPLESNLRLPPT